MIKKLVNLIKHNKAAFIVGIVVTICWMFLGFLAAIAYAWGGGSMILVYLLAAPLLLVNLITPIFGSIVGMIITAILGGFAGIFLKTKFPKLFKRP